MIYVTNDTLTREDLREIDPPVRADVSSRYRAVRHGDLADSVIKQAEAARLMIDRETWYTNPNQDTLYGAVDFRRESPALAEHNLKLPPYANFSLGIRHSNLSRYAVSFCVGARIIVCSNGMFTGSFVLKSKHTSGLDLDRAVSAGIRKYLEEAEELDRFIGQLQAKPVTDQEATHVMVQAIREEVLPPTYLKLVDAHWKVDNRFGDMPTAWRLYNAFTSSAKEMPVARQLIVLDGIKVIFQSLLGVGSGYTSTIEREQENES